ncbi:hypothetical protein [Brasilonema sp. UFV-L1]|uniref:hypothetical protein n=1 Tax=Brasilonema sp. UFV-L1 TaxID=2234130 RepID=UPI00145CBD8C|nr:hypothetical protein [Brasilonema sp. UFV-L1]NMG08153.1 hypothetical protein [Brasilonema sp. UFV-L1]
MYYIPQQAPYFLLIVGLFAAVTSDLALWGTLKLSVQKWQDDGAETSGSRIAIKDVSIPFIGVTIGLCVFLCSGFEIFGLPPLLACGIGIPVALLTALLIWLQLGSMLTFVERQGIQALDLDS